MTGRRLYDLHTDAIGAVTSEWQRNRGGDVGQVTLSPKAWPVLELQERKLWNEMARRLTPKPKDRS